MFYMMLDGIVGMEISLLCYAVCTAAYFLFCFLFKANRTGKKRVLLGWVICEIFCDILWYLIFYQDGNYVNHGIGGAAALFLLPLVYFSAGIILSLINYKKS